MFDRIIVSCDDSHFKDFWQIVAKSWNKYYPNVNISLAFVTKRNANDPLVIKMKELHCYVTLIVIPNLNNKYFRYY
jgi:hypothetical protein